MALPAFFTLLETDMPPSDSTAISAVPLPMSAINTPCGVVMSMPQPRAAAFGVSIRYTLRAPKVLTALTTARFSTSVSSHGMAVTTRGFEILTVHTSLSRMSTMSSTKSDCAITPPSSGCAARMPTGVLPIMAYASSPTAKISWVSTS